MWRNRLKAKKFGIQFQVFFGKCRGVSHFLSKNFGTCVFECFFLVSAKGCHIFCPKNLELAFSSVFLVSAKGCHIFVQKFWNQRFRMFFLVSAKGCHIFCPKIFVSRLKNVAGVSLWYVRELFLRVCLVAQGGIAIFLSKNAVSQYRKTL